LIKLGAPNTHDVETDFYKVSYLEFTDQKGQHGVSQVTPFLISGPSIFL